LAPPPAGSGEVNDPADGGGGDGGCGEGLGVDLRGLVGDLRPLFPEIPGLERNKSRGSESLETIEFLLYMF
jgi:hypothetical protein